MNPAHANFREAIEPEKGRILECVLLEYITRGNLLKLIASSFAQLDSNDHISIRVGKDVWLRLQEYKNNLS